MRLAESVIEEQAEPLSIPSNLFSIPAHMAVADPSLHADEGNGDKEESSYETLLPDVDTTPSEREESGQEERVILQLSC